MVSTDFSARVNNRYPAPMAKIVTPSKSQRTSVREKGDSPNEMLPCFGCKIHEIEGRVKNQMIAADMTSPINLFPIWREGLGLNFRLLWPQVYEGMYLSGEKSKIQP